MTLNVRSGANTGVQQSPDFSKKVTTRGSKSARDVLGDNLKRAPSNGSKNFRQVELRAEHSGDDIAGLGLFKGRDIRRIRPSRLLQTHEIHCHSAKNRFTRFLTSIFSLGRIRYRNIKISLSGGKTTTVAVNIQQFSKQYHLSSQQKASLLHARNDTERTDAFVAIVKQRIEFVSTIKKAMKPQPGETAEEWAKRTVEKTGIIKGRNYCQHIYALELAPDQAHYYVQLQQELAKILPKESHRPTIDLELIGSKVPRDGSAFTLGILGGVGPVSDSVITQQTIDKLRNSGIDLDTVSINVFSCPPPRKKREFLSNGRLKSYLDNLQRFARQGHQVFGIASNTAHVHVDFLRTFGFEKRLKNMVQEVCADVQRDTNPKATGVLVLGTTQGYDNNLYPKELKRYGVKGLTVTTGEKQNNLQKIIDRTKAAGDDSEKEALYLFAENEIKELRKKQDVSHVLLGCTELPLALGHDYIKRLEESLNVKIVDTEEKFSDKFAEMVAAGSPTAGLLK